MQLFYSDKIQDELIYLPKEEAFHASKVLRLLKGEIVHVTDGKGNLYLGTIEHLDHKGGIVKIISSEKTLPRKASLHIAIAPTKNIDRFEWFLEKACEFGIERITPLICKRSERKDLRTDRLQKILISGMKQSLHYYLPVLEEPELFSSLVEKTKIESNLIRGIAHCENRPKLKLKEILSPEKSVVILIGPEGDFNSDEIELAVKEGFLEIDLGSSRLRTETAGIAVAHTFAMAQDKDI